MMMRRSIYAFLAGFISTVTFAQKYPQGYFRHPLNIPMELVANFGEIRTNHWHMGLDIRTKQRVNLPVYAAAEGYISRVVVEPGGFGQAIYINHPNGYTTLYAHMNGFYPALANYVKSQQYAKETWHINLILPAGMFKVNKGDYIGLSGSTGGSAGPHVHFEIRDTETEKCLNPLLFRFPIADAVPPTISRVAMYDRNRSVYAQSPQFISTAPGTVIKVGSDKISFAIAATDRFTRSNNPNGIYAASVSVDNKPVSSFRLDNIGYDETRYMNAQVDYKYDYSGGAAIQHLSPLPGAAVSYSFEGDGIIHLNDREVHSIKITAADPNGNTSTRNFRIQYDPSIGRIYTRPSSDRFLPNHVNVFEREDFEVFTTDKTVYDTVDVNFSATETTGAVSRLFTFLHPSIPSHDFVTVRIKTNLTQENADRVIIKNVSGKKTFVRKAVWQKGWLSAHFRQFGTYVALIDNEPPTVNAPSTNLTKARSISFTPRDNHNVIKNFRAELDGKWLRFTNDKGKTWTYSFDEHFPRGSHELKVTVEDEAGNVTTRTWNVIR